MTLPHPSDVKAAMAENRARLLGTIAAIQAAAAPIDLNAKPERKP